jgi:hypothetical protein
MAVNANGDAVVRKSYRCLPYFAGKGQQFFFTFDGLESVKDASTMCFVIDKTGTETLRVSRSSWDDPMDGTGASGLNLDFTKSQILLIDYEWLGVGAVRFSFVVNGVIYQAHKYGHANVGNSTYMTTGNQPIRYEIRQDATNVTKRVGCWKSSIVSPFTADFDGIYLESVEAGSSGSFEMICATAGSEGAENQLGKARVVSTGANTVNANTAGTMSALCGMRLRASELDAAVVGRKILVISTTNDEFYWEVRANPTVAGTFTYSDLSNSVVQTAVGDTTGNPSTNTVTGGVVVDFGYGAAFSDVQASVDDISTGPGAALDGTQDTFVLCVTPVTGSSNLDIAGGFSWKEID